LGVERGIVLKNPVPQTLAWHGLWAVTGVFGVLFPLLEFFSKLIIYTDWINQGCQEKYFSATEKNHRNPEFPFFAEPCCYTA